MVYLETIKREFGKILKFKGLIIILFVGPLFLTLFFGGVYYNDYIKDIPIAVLDEDGSSMSNLVSNYFLSNERFEITHYPTSKEELEALINDGEVQMGLCIPQGFESDVTTFQSSEILTILDGSNIVVAGNAYAQASLIIQTISAGVEMKLIEGKGVSPLIAENLALVYNVSERVLFDSKMTYMNYLIICFLAVFIQQLMLAAMGSLFNRDSEYLSNDHVLIKALAMTSTCALGMVPAIVICMIILSKLFHVAMVGSLWVVALMTLVFIMALIGPSLMIASLTKDRVRYSQISFMLSLPTFVSSGCVWPLEQMPKAFENIIRVLWPLMNYAKIVQEILIKGRDFSTVIPNILQMLVFSLVWIPIGVFCYKKAYSNKEVYSNEKEAKSIVQVN